MPPPYSSYAALAAEQVEGVDYSRTAVSPAGAKWAAIAIHGGGIEGGSGEMAQQVAGSDLFYYQFAGLKSSGNNALHITSSLFDEPMCVALVESSAKTVSFHGYAGTAGVAETAIGGLDSELVARIKARLQAAGFAVITAPSEIAGTNPANICNKNSVGAGVQLEMSNALRASFFTGGSTSAASRAGPRTPAFYAYAAAVRAALAEVDPGTARGLPWFGGLVTLIAEAALTTATGSYGAWDAATWDAATWGPDVLWTDLSQRLKTPLQTDRGFGREVAEWEAGTATIRLDNNDGALSPDNLAGPFVTAGVTAIRPLRPVRLLATYRGVTYPLYAGYALDWIETITRGPADIAQAIVEVPAADEKSALAALDGFEQPPAGAGELSGQRIHRILNNAGHTGERRIDPGRITMQATTLNANAFTEAQLTTDSEGGALWVEADGAWVFEHQYALIENTRSNTVQAVFGDGPGELPVYRMEFAYAGDLLKNMAAFARAGGTSQLAADPTSRALYHDRLTKRTDLIAESDAQVKALADWWVQRYKDPERRVTQIQIKPRTDPQRLFPQVLGRRVRDLIRVRRRAPGGFVISRDCHIAGISHVISRDDWITTFDLWSASPYTSFSTSRWDVGTWDSAQWFY